MSRVKRGYVGGLHGDGVVIGYVGVNARALPFVTHGVDGDPLHAVVREGPGGELHAAGKERQAAIGIGVDEAADGDLGVGMIAVRGVGAPDSGEAESFLGHEALHDVGRFALRILIAVVGNDRGLIEIARVVGGVVKVPEFLFVPGGFGAILVHVGELAGLGKTRSRRKDITGGLPRVVELFEAASRVRQLSSLRLTVSYASARSAKASARSTLLRTTALKKNTQCPRACISTSRRMTAYAPANR